MVAFRKAQDRADFAAVHQMRAAMAQWDAEQTRAMGYPADGVAEAYYGDSIEDLHRMFTAPDAAMLLAHRGDTVLGHAGFTRFDALDAELLLVWLDPAARGAGVARRMLNLVLSGMRDTGYAGAVLETAPFMADAIRLYQSLGFAACPPFRDPPPDLAPITIFMRARL